MSPNSNDVGFRTCSDLPATKNIFTSSAPRKDGYVYKRRKLHGSSVALVSQENPRSIKGSSDSSLNSEDHLSRAKKDDLIDNGNLPIPQNDLVPNSLLNTVHTVREDEVPIEASLVNLPNDRYSSSEHNMGHCRSFVKSDVDAGECSSSNIAVLEPFEELTSAKELCISVLRRHGLLGGVWSPSSCNSFEVLCYDDPKRQQSCKICGLLENPVKMLICDLCEGAFHLSCCNPRIKKLPVDEWYCQPCFRKKPKPFLEKTKVANPEHRRRMSNGDVDLISFMLKDTQPYTTGVRIGKDFQAEVPEWCGPISDDKFEPIEMDPAESEFTSLNGWNCNYSSKPSSIGNWIQCREVIDTNENDEDVVCGKWRRAPLFLSQTDDWDCSCSILWDPIHADCAVPQELETEEVVKQLKYIEMLRPRLAEKKQRKHDQT